MKEIQNVLILGLGAIGSIYATKLQDFDSSCVKVLLDEARYEKYSQRGIKFNGRDYHFNYVLDTEKNTKADLILIATKAGDFEKASDMINNFVDEDTIILSLLNGISSEEILFKKYGKKNVLYSYYIGHASVKTEKGIEYDGIGTIVFGAKKNKEFSAQVKSVKDFFDKVGIDYKIPEDMLSSLWQKFVINIGINQSLAIVNSTYSALQNSEYSRKIAIGLMEEAVEVAKAAGISDTDNFLNVALELIDSMPPELMPSMRQDVLNKKPTEVDIFAGEICRLGKKYTILTPKNEMAFNIIKSIEEKY